MAKLTVSEIRKLSLAAGGKFFSRENMKASVNSFVDGYAPNDRISDFKVTIEGENILLEYKDIPRNELKRKNVWLFNPETHRLSPYGER